MDEREDEATLFSFFFQVLHDKVVSSFLLLKLIISPKLSKREREMLLSAGGCWKKNKIKTRGLLKVVMWSWSLLLTNQSPDKFLSPYFFQCSQTHEADSFYCSAITATKLLDLRLYSEENPETVPAFIAWPWRHTALGFSSRLAWHLAVNWIWH